MRRAVGGVALLAGLAAALFVGTRDQGTPAGLPDDLMALRATASLAPCPKGIGDVPDLTLPCLGGGADVRLRGAPSGVPTLVNVYGSWCTPCQEEMPVLVKFAGRAAGKVALVGVDTQDDPRLALRFAADFGQRWPAVVDEQGTFLRRYSPGPPVTLFVDAAGAVRFVHLGKFADTAQLEAAVARHLGVRL